MYKKITFNTALFILADLINKIIPFLLLPILTNYLGASDYGVLSIYNSILSFAQILIGFSIVGFLNLNYFKHTKEERKKIVSASILFFVIISILNIILGLFINQYVLPEITPYWTIIISLTGLFFNLNNLILSIWILEQNPLSFSIFQITETFIKVSISLLLIVWIGFNWTGRAYGILLGTFSLSFVSLFTLYKKDLLTINNELKYYLEIYKYGITLLVHQISQWLKQNIDKILILALLGKTSTGIYSVAIQFGIILGILTTAFNKSWVPYFYKQIQNPENYRTIVKFILFYIPIILFIAIILYFVSKYIIITFFKPEFHSSINYIPFILLAYSFQGMYFMVVNYMFYLKKNKIMSLISFITTAIHILLIYIGITKYGLIGAAGAFALTYFFIFLTTSIVVTFLFKKHIEIGI